MPKQLLISPRKCIGCKSCELTCSLVNGEGFNPSRARIAVVTFLEGDYSLPYHFVSTCRQCADAPCAASCPVQAIRQSNDATKRITIDDEACIGCGKCVTSCPFGAMMFDAETRTAFKCELCDGHPACADMCPTGAIKFASRRYYYAQEEDLQMRGYGLLQRRHKAGVRREGSPRRREGIAGSQPV